MATPEELAAQSAQYLNTSVSPNTGGDPRITRQDLVGGNILQGADGNQYYFAPREYVNRGFVYDMGGRPFQMYNSRFLDGAVFKNAQQFTSPDGVPGFVWKKQDAINLQLTNTQGDSRVGGYYITGDEPAIIGIGNPNATRDDHLGLMAYVTVPRKVSDQMVNQDYITNDGTFNGLHWDGERGYQYILQGWVPDMLRKALPTVNAIMPIVMEVLAPGTGAGATYATYSAGTAATLEALRTGNLEKGVVDLAKIYAAGQVADLISKGVSAYTPVAELGNVAKTILGGAGTNAIVQGLYGKDVGKAFIDGGIQAGINAAAGSISGFSQLPVSVQRVFAAAVATSLQGKSAKEMDAATLQAAIASGLGAMANGIEANSKVQKELGREATPEELNQFIWYTNRDANFNNKVYDYMGGVKKNISLENGFDTYTLDGVDYKIPAKELDNFAKSQDWSSWAEKQDAAKLNIANPDEYRDAVARNEGWQSDAEKATAKLGGFDSPSEYTTATAMGLDSKSEYQDYQNKANIFKEVTGRDATIDDVKKYVANIPTQADARNVMRELTSGKKAEEIDKKYDYNGDGLVNFSDAIDMLKAAVGTSTVKPNPNTVWGQTGATDAEFRQRVTDNIEEEAERLRLAGLKEQSDREAAEAAVKAEDERKAQEAAKQAAIDEQNRIDQEAAKQQAADEAERLRLAGLQEKGVDLNKVVAGTDTAVASNGADTVIAGSGADTVEGGTDTTDDAEQAKRVADFGKDLTGGGVQDLGDVDTKTDFYDADSTGTGAYKYDPTSGTYTYTSDDGSTLTLDGDGNIVGFTEASDTPWTGLTDTATGNLNLPKLPGGITPTVKAPAKKTTKTTTTGTGTTAITSGGSTVVQSGGNTAIQTGLNIPALLAIMGGLNQQPQQVQQDQETTPEFQYFDWEASPFASTKEKTNPSGRPKMASGGSIDELLEILRRSGI